MKARMQPQISRRVPFLIVVFLFGLPAHAQYGGGTGEPNDPYLICTARHLDDMSATTQRLDRHFKLMAHIEMGKWTPKNFRVIGLGPGRAFTGTFDGNGYTISNLTYILSGARENNIGLFGYVGDASNDAVIKNLGLIDPNIDALTRGTGDNIGALVGCLFSGRIVNCYVEGGRVLGNRCVGGLVGGSVMTPMMVIRVLENCHAATPVSGIREVGGLVGCHDWAPISRCYATGNVCGYENVGGLVGVNLGGLYGCFATGRVLGINYSGGLVGLNDGPGEILDCYSTGRVLGDSYVGGLAGANQGLVAWCYSRGSVEGMTRAGGLAGSLRLPFSDRDVVVADSFWDMESSDQTTSAGGIGKTTPEMQTAAIFLAAGWDFVGETANGTEDIWRILEGQDYPRLAWEHELGDESEAQK